MDIPPEVTTDISEQGNVYRDQPLHDQETGDYQDPNDVLKDEPPIPSMISNDDIPPILIDPIHSQTDEEIVMPSFPREDNGLAALGKKCLENHGIFLVLILCFYICISIFAIATVPFYVTILRLLSCIIGFIGVRFRNKPAFMLIFLGMLIQLLIITPISGLYFIVSIFFNDWDNLGKFFVILLVLVLFTCLGCLETCGFLKTIKVMKTRKKIRREERLEEKEQQQLSNNNNRRDDLEFNNLDVEDPIVPVSIEELQQQGGLIIQQNQNSNDLILEEQQQQELEDVTITIEDQSGGGNNNNNLPPSSSLEYHESLEYRQPALEGSQQTFNEPLNGVY